MHLVGVKPWQIVEVINRRQRSDALPSLPAIPNSPPTTYLGRYNNSRHTLCLKQVGIVHLHALKSCWNNLHEATKVNGSMIWHNCSTSQVKAVIQKRRRSQGLTGSDVNAVDCLVHHYSEQHSVLHYQPYRPGSNSTQEQPVAIMISTPFQQRMLDQFGRRLVFLDATGGTNKYGYMLHTLLVQDDFGRGVPVAFMLSSSEETEAIHLFLEKSAEAVSDEHSELPAQGTC